MQARIASVMKAQVPTTSYLLSADGPTVPADGTAGYATGCIFHHTDGGAGTALYQNEGTEASCDFNEVASLTAAQEALLGATAGVVTASRAVIVDASKNAGDFNNLDAVNIDAGADAVAGTVDIFPATTGKGKFILSCDNQDGATNVTLKPAGMAQASVISIPDPGAATANVMLTSQPNDQAPVTATSAELNVLGGVTAGTVAASKGVVVDSDKDIGDFRDLDAVNIDAGADAVAGTVDIFPATTAKGKFILSCDDQDGATNVTFKPAPMGQASVISIPDPGAATANVMLTSQPNDQAPVTATSAELNVLAAVTAGVVAASKGVVVDNNKDIGDFRNIKAAGAVTIKAGAATPAVALRFGASETEGLEVKVYNEVVAVTNAVTTDTTCVIPAGAVILSVQANLETIIAGDTTGDNLLAKVGIGFTGDENAYGVTSDLTKNLKVDTIPDWAVLGAPVTVAIYALQADGATACTEKFVAGGQVRVRVVYLVLNSLDDAA